MPVAPRPLFVQVQPVPRLAEAQAQRPAVALLQAPARSYKLLRLPR
ncbi:MAG: hypothetical protein IIC23_10090 [Chloroflexi bacterium]|nr:hypothetical protein [Chloroflexota bacterium]